MYSFLCTSAINKGFYWLGPPVITFTWRHWSEWSGPYQGNPPSGQTLEMFGSAVVRVNDKLQIEDMDIFYDPNQILMPLNCKGACSMSS